jgi:hypothetical protein
MEDANQDTPLAVYVSVSALFGFAVAGAVLMWLERGPAILLDLSGLSAAFICL